MQEVKTQKRYKCDYCSRRSVKRAMLIHEKRCFRNPNRFCDYCENNGFTMETIVDGYPDQKTSCHYCEKFDKKMLEEIKEREAKLI